jgi:hypothetical protein
MSSLPMRQGPFRPPKPAPQTWGWKMITVRERYTREHPVRTAGNPVLGLRWSKRVEQHEQDKHRRGPSTPRHQALCQAIHL